ncbi:MAG TPA: hypothetical protein VJ904_08235, partial [Tichowtungia sp.]|nr:hypothetical protein [Tichowtungia sp.]
APVIANGTVWFQFPAQQGWRYEIRTISADSSNVVTDIRLLSEDDLEATAKVASTAGFIFTAQRSGVHYVELSGGAGTVAVRYLGVE